MGLGPAQPQGDALWRTGFSPHRGGWHCKERHGRLPTGVGESGDGETREKRSRVVVGVLRVAAKPSLPRVGQELPLTGPQRICAHTKSRITATNMISGETTEILVFFAHFS